MSFKRNGLALADFLLAWIFILCAHTAHAQLTTTTISNTLYHADGTPATGTVLISWPAFSTLTGSSVPAGSTAITIATNGTLTAQLVPNAGATPIGSYYTAVYHLDDGSVTREYWVVPVSSGTVAISAIRSTVLPLSVAMQTVSKSYVDTAIATALAAHPTPPAASSTTTVTLGYLDGSSTNSGGNTFSVVNLGAATQAGTITQVKATIASFTAGTGQLTFAVFAATSTDQYQIVTRVPLTVTGTGVQTWNAGTNFVAPSIAPGQFTGYLTSPNAVLEFGGNSPTTALTWYYGGDPGAASVTYNQGGTQSLSAVETITSGSAPSGPYTGLRLGVWGHSLTVPGYEYTGVAGTSFTYWQQDLASQLGMTWTFNDGLAGRGYFNLFTNYPGLSLSNMNALSTGSSSNGGLNGGPTTSGTTLAQDLANVDLLLLWNGDNDYGAKPLGSPGDAAAANTNYGDLDNALSILFTAKPTLRVMLIDHGYAGRSFGLAGYQAIHQWLTTGGQSYGVGVMDMLSLSGLNPLTWSTWMNADSGQYLHPTSAGWAHFVPIMAHSLSAY